MQSLNHKSDVQAYGAANLLRVKQLDSQLKLREMPRKPSPLSSCFAVHSPTTVDARWSPENSTCTLKTSDDEQAAYFASSADNQSLLKSENITQYRHVRLQSYHAAATPFLHDASA